MGSDLAAARCLNCGEPLNGPFCSKCGQRAIPAYPTLRELVGDAWQELSGYDGRVVRTFRHLMLRPGALTLEVLEGHRARYVSPVRLYLVASVLYFLISAASPNVIQPPPRPPARGDFNIDLRNPETAVAQLSPEKRAEILGSIERAPWWMRPVLRSAVLDPIAFKQRVVQTLPRVLFALVPVCAAILALFYRRRPFSQHLIFALHVHAVIFLAAAVREAADFTYSPAVVGILGLAALIFTLRYVLLALRTVSRERWRVIVLKSLGVTVVYGVACLAGIVVTLGLASLG
jgi:Protein of unknown function (DUF3667)